MVFFFSSYTANTYLFFVSYCQEKKKQLKKLGVSGEGLIQGGTDLSVWAPVWVRQAQTSEISCLHRIRFPNSGGGGRGPHHLHQHCHRLTDFLRGGIASVQGWTNPRDLFCSGGHDKGACRRWPRHALASRAPLFKQASSQHKKCHREIQFCSWASGEQRLGKRVTQDTRSYVSAAVCRGLLTRGLQMELAEDSYGVATPLCSVPCRLIHLSAATSVPLVAFIYTMVTQGESLQDQLPPCDSRVTFTLLLFFLPGRGL